jgi:Ca-activated chloride channel family protein
MFVFKDPTLLWLLLIVPVVALVSLFKRTRASFRFPADELLEGIKPTMRQRLNWVPAALRCAAITLVILALARPQTVLSHSKTVTEGVDIVIDLDTSTSMLAEDFKVGNQRVNRFNLIKEVVKDFIGKRKDDRIALVAFAARAYTVCPLSTDYQWLYDNLDRVRVGMIEDATAIGSALASSLNRLRTSKTKSRIIILLTDGINNAGNISPLVSAEAAKALKVKIYTIGVGSKGLVPYPMQDQFGRTVYQNIPIEIDEETLKKIADETGGKYYRASDTETLWKIYDDINRLEKSNIEHYGYMEFNELFVNFLIPALILFAVEILLSNTVFLKVP